jgi:DNA repair protein RadC
MPDREPLIREIPKDDRPRERLLAAADRAELSDAQLIAVLLRSGPPEVGSLGLAKQLLDEHGGLSGLVGACPATIKRRGLGVAKIAALLAAVEIGRRLARGELRGRNLLSRPAEVARYLVLKYQKSDQEVMGALFLDVRHRLIGESEIYRGTMHRAAVEPREILKQCLARGAAGVALFHTHPSGDPTPSSEDMLFTRRMAEAAEVVGVELVDHLVLGATGLWVSLRDRCGW